MNRSAVRPSVFCLALGLLVCCRAGLTAAPDRAGDPVEVLRRALLGQADIPRPDDPEHQALRKTLLAARKDALGKAASAVRSVGELGRALLLREWRVSDPDSEVADTDLKVYREMATRFQKAATNVSQRGNAVTRTALANLVAHLAEQVPPLPGPVLQAQTAHLFARNLKQVEPDLIKLAATDDGRQAVAAARMLGKAARILDRALPALADMIASAKTPQGGRQAAAEALASLAGPPVSSRGLPKPQVFQPGDHPEVIRFLGQVATAVGPGLADADPKVRQRCATALKQAGRQIRDSQWSSASRRTFLRAVS